MDPLSISASIIALLQVSGAVIELLSAIASASSDIRSLAVEIGTTRSLLSSILDLTDTSEGWNECLRNITTKNGPVPLLEDLLTKLERHLNREASVEKEFRQLKKKLTWPWRKEETQKMLKTARIARGLLAEALAVDHLALTKELRQETREIHEEFQTLQLRQDENQQSLLLEWLSSVDVTETHYATRNKHEPGTGEWLLTSDTYNLWLHGTMELMWLYGIPGSGKTVHCSTIIENVQDLCASGKSSRSICIYYYFDFKYPKRQTLDGLVKSALAQFCQQSTNIPSEVVELYEERGRKGQDPSPEKIKETLILLLKQHSGRTYIILDALDESREQENILDLISKIQDGQGWSVNALISSRKEQQIEASLSFLATQKISLHGPNVHDDIQKLVHRVLLNDPVLAKRPISMKKEIEQALTAGANGMFRWASCQLDALRSCLTPSAVRKTLQSLPQSLDETYGRILCGIDEEVYLIAFTALQFLMASSRPVDLAELSEMVAIRPGTSIFSDIDRLFDPKDLMVVCSSLITQSRAGFVQLSHYSVREFLISERICEGPASHFAIRDSEAHLAIAERCLTYLLSFDQPVIPTEIGSESLHSSALSSTSTLAEHLTLYEQLVDDYPLLEYSASEWYTHARLVPSEHQIKIEPMILHLLDQNNTAFHHWISLYGLGEDAVRPGNSLYYASKLGLPSVVQKLLNQGVDINYVGGQYGSPLSGASYFGQDEVVRILLEHGSNVNVQAGTFNTPLQTACVERRTEIFHLLLTYGADINTTGGYYGCALQAAAARGWPEAALELIELGADVNAVKGQFGTVLQAASRYGRDELVMKLLDRGANVNATGGYYHTALQAAARGGHLSIVQLLLEHGADVSIEGGFCGNALNAAYSRHNHHVAEVLKAQISMETGKTRRL
ncbi:hypothetical protein N7462_002007 [Penicillium macrosclerotiorum]|uniref:uncharacterized protein n=1 Tax=Penicillium macrosclerotiorum TaxID=303699 RepID=UPI0025478D6D|nr:uncharacterized protein N7462_002007 [Penicillium macrosclerotiorum]KAJ5692584.1 hypothetical protein N7462_002007 [Penicillium macrosclerotiorum]